ncbi:hypothetical protein CEE69_11320 [Rhodopirellula bahusiensis]|uniref:Uncharacterized protein n=1 Tax=Rhodopirellula bahusiensis TaxID=2014065 RepID=A0A2G1W7M1_9BACT|nr:hypothetical protein CEE69_11320 [Rhodopirellula bahusiensis]
MELICTHFHRRFCAHRWPTWPTPDAVRIAFSGNRMRCIDLVVLHLAPIRLNDTVRSVERMAAVLNIV